MLVLAMEFSRGTTAYRPPPLPGNEKGTVRSSGVSRSGGCRLESSEELGFRRSAYGPAESRPGND
jgi:hypothetical protein